MMPGSAFVGAGIPLSAIDISDTARGIGCSPRAFCALLHVETAMKGFDTLRRPVILYEPHVAFRTNADNTVLQKRLQDAGLAYPVWGTMPYPVGQDAQYLRLDAAVSIVGRERAIQACSWGIGQILGENYRMLNFTSAASMISDAMSGERAQLRQIASFLARANLTTALVKQAWFALAQGYNGKANASAYALKLSNAYAALGNDEPVVAVPRVQQGAPVNLPLHPARPPSISADDLTAQWAKQNGLNLS